MIVGKEPRTTESGVVSRLYSLNSKDILCQSAIGFKKDIYQIRSCSKAEHANFTGEKRRRMFVEKLKETKRIKRLESNMPTSKTVRVSKYSTYLQYVLEHLETLFSFYGCKRDDMSKVKISDECTVYGTKDCKTCIVLWQRDVNAPKNMLDIAASIWNGCGRPESFVKNCRSGNSVDSLQEEMI
ncbi:MAG: hypothetical protein EXX96DRAFT_625986 [Benjaminiella poitrasii]|nr:MAG: hypothetical protein EXX96DRAFT_625986 [Benjaminiella poitrasii]